MSGVRTDPSRAGVFRHHASDGDFGKVSAHGARTAQIRPLAEALPKAGVTRPLSCLLCGDPLSDGEALFLVVSRTTVYLLPQMATI